MLPVIKLEDPDYPIVLPMKPDGELDAGSEPYEVHGRTITGQNDNQAIHWYLKVERKAGANSVTLDQRNATPMN